MDNISMFSAVEILRSKYTRFALNHALSQVNLICHPT